MSAPDDGPSEPPELAALRDLYADIINAPSRSEELAAEAEWLRKYEIRVRAAHTRRRL